MPRIKKELDWIATDITRDGNDSAPAQFGRIEPERSRIELFDMVWWMYFQEDRAKVTVRAARGEPNALTPSRAE